MAVTIFFVGAGVTIVDLCCSNCVENLISIEKKKGCHESAAEMIIDAGSHSCCKDDTAQEQGLLPCTNEHDGKCCDAERISVDLDNRVFKPDVTNHALALLVVHCQCCCFCHTTEIEQTSVYTPYADIPIPPREYLSLLRVLII